MKNILFNITEVYEIAKFLNLEVIETHPNSTKTYKIWTKIIPYIGNEEFDDLDFCLKYTDEIHVYDTKFHRSWEWLMYLYEKIEESGADVLFDKSDVSITVGGEFLESTGDILDGTAEFEIWKHENSKFENAYISAVEYVKWYNKNNSVDNNVDNR